MLLFFKNKSKKKILFIFINLTDKTVVIQVEVILPIVKLEFNLMRIFVFKNQMVRYIKARDKIFH